MALSENLKTWGNMNIELIEDVYEKIYPLIAFEPCDSKTRTKLKKLMEAMLPDYIIKCDDENNPSVVIDGGNIFLTVSTKKFPDGSHNYVNVIF